MTSKIAIGISLVALGVIGPQSPKPGSIRNPVPLPLADANLLLPELYDFPSCSVRVWGPYGDLAKFVGNLEFETSIRSAVADSRLRVYRWSDTFLNASPGRFSEDEGEVLRATDSMYRQLRVETSYRRSQEGTSYVFRVELKALRAGFVVPGRFTSAAVYETYEMGTAETMSEMASKMKKAIKTLCEEFLEKWRICNPVK